MKRRKVAIVLIMLMLISISLPAYGEEAEMPGNVSLLEGRSSRYEPVCGHYATHDMKSRGFGYLRDTRGNVIFSLESCFQCTRCYLVLVCQGEPTLGESIGYWATYDASEPTNVNGTVVVTDNYYYTTDSTLPGMSFRD